MYHRLTVIAADCNLNKDIMKCSNFKCLCQQKWEYDLFLLCPTHFRGLIWYKKENNAKDNNAKHEWMESKLRQGNILFSLNHNTNHLYNRSCCIGSKLEYYFLNLFIKKQPFKLLRNRIMIVIIIVYLLYKSLFKFRSPLTAVPKVDKD